MEGSMPQKKKNTPWSWFLRKFRSILIAGLVVVVPIGLTVWIMIWVFNGIENTIQPLIRFIFGRTYPGIGFAIAFILILIVGSIATNVIGRRLLSWGETMLGKIPIVKHLYGALKDISHSLSDPSQSGFLQVVLIEFPAKGMKTIAFITNEETDKNGRKLINLFIPTAINPTGGFLEIVREEDIVRTKISIEDGLKLAVSAGKTSPRELSESMQELENKIPGQEEKK
jgi:uncharacterized membrane protein